jgi:hypothetical protein
MTADAFRPADHQHAELKRDYAQPVGDILADAVKLAGTARTATILQIGFISYSVPVRYHAPSKSFLLRGS